MEIVRNRGACVRAISLAEALHVVEARATLEGLVAGRAAERVDREQTETLRALTADMREAFDRGRLTRYGELSTRLHELVYDIAGHETAHRIIQELRARTVRQPDVVSLMGNRTATSLSEPWTSSRPSQPEIRRRLRPPCAGT
ncbi:FCD domain-containing protein [Streptomyces sp. NPDC051976]|uniref:GntR family transcriptional regulator n=1 Tax=Streptomyces sp. NPDC051976 TaxID=3154947 RepID=UPI0034263D76